MTADWPYLAAEDRGPARPGDPTVGVLITAHDVAAFVPQALQSVSDQTRAPDEVVVVDDASRDDVDAAVQPWRARVRVVRRQQQGGEGAAKNTGLAALSTDLAVVLDGDDAMHPRRLEALHWLAVQRPDLDVLTTEWEEFGDGPARPSWSLAERFPVRDQVDAILRFNFLPAPALRREVALAVGGFDETLRYGPDWELYARMLVRGSRAGLVAAPLYRYRQWGGQQTADRRRVLQGRVAVLQRISADPLLSPRQRAAVARILEEHRSAVWAHSAAHGTGSRREAAHVLRTPSLTAKRRALAALSLVSPRAAASVARRRGAG